MIDAYTSFKAASLRFALALSLMLAVGCAGPLNYPRTSPGPAMAAQPPAPLATSPQRAAPSTAVSKSTSNHRSTSARPAASAEQSPGQIGSLVDYAGSLVGASSIIAAGESFRKDCSGLVRACYYSQGLDLFAASEPGRSGTESIYRFIKEHGEIYEGGTLQPGDIVFFHNTYDRNHNGRRDDLFTHVAIVESVDSRGTATLIHSLNSGIGRTQMNLKHPDVHKDPATGQVLNDYLRRADSKHDASLTSELCVSFGRLF